jgi:hypothetical protein
MPDSDNYTFFENTEDVLNTRYKTEITEKRIELDKKLNNLYKNKNIIKETQQKEINSNVYANIMLTILATSLLYFSFVKITK